MWYTFNLIIYKRICTLWWCVLSIFCDSMLGSSQVSMAFNINLIKIVTFASFLLRNILVILGLFGVLNATRSPAELSMWVKPCLAVPWFREWTDRCIHLHDARWLVTVCVDTLKPFCIPLVVSNVCVDEFEHLDQPRNGKKRDHLWKICSCGLSLDYNIWTKITIKVIIVFLHNGWHSCSADI